MSPIAEWGVWITGVGDPVKQTPACPSNRNVQIAPNPIFQYARNALQKKIQKNVQVFKKIIRKPLKDSEKHSNSQFSGSEK
jgi:DNA-binding transcriptional regulator GbsR (MarR family)